MSSKSALAVSRTHDDWIPLLEQAARKSSNSCWAAGWL